jgi:glyoxylase-like metal-dependent hydrolase (beta-lactamase superfamily II)
MQRVVIPVTPFVQNCSLIWCEQTRRAAVIDPGGDLPKIRSAIEEAGVAVERVLLTHGHLDHVGAAAELSRLLGVPVEGPHAADRFWLDALPEQAQMFGLPPPAATIVPDRWLADGDAVAVGERRLTVLHCPGHTPGHVAFFDPEARLAFVGDVIFAGSIGRTDFPGGNQADLLRSIRERLFPLGDDVCIVPGHGPKSTIGEERRYNPFLSGRYG